MYLLRKLFNFDLFIVISLKIALSLFRIKMHDNCIFFALSAVLRFVVHIGRRIEYIELLKGNSFYLI